MAVVKTSGSYYVRLGSPLTPAAWPKEAGTSDFRATHVLHRVSMGGAPHQTVGVR
jgi:hypothetical protein